MRRLTTFIARPALEDKRAPGQTTEVPAAEAADKSAEVAGGDSDELPDLSELHGEIDETAQIMEALESIATCLGQSAAVGGLDQHAAQAVRISVESYYSAVGVTDYAFPALESFADNEGRKLATESAMQNIKAQAKKIWRAIVAAIQKAMAWLKAFFAQTAKSAEKLKVRAQELDAKVKGLKATTQGQKITNAKIISAVTTTEGFDYSALKSTINLLEEVIVGRSISDVEELGRKVVAALAHPKEAVEGFALNHLRRDYMSELKDYPEKVKDGMGVFAASQMAGRKRLLLIEAKERPTGFDAVELLRETKFLFVDAPMKAAAVKEIPALTIGECQDVCEMVADLATLIFKAESENKRLDGVREAIIDKANALAASADKMADDAPEAKHLRAAQHMAQAMARLLDQPRAQMTAYALQFSKAMLNWVEESAEVAQSIKEDKKEPAAA